MNPIKTTANLFLSSFHDNVQISPSQKSDVFNTPFVQCVDVFTVLVSCLQQCSRMFSKFFSRWFQPKDGMKRSRNWEEMVSMF